MIFMAPYPHQYQPRHEVTHETHLQRLCPVAGHDLVSVSPGTDESFRIVCECGWNVSLPKDIHYLAKVDAMSDLYERVRAHEDEERAKGGLTLEELEALGWFDEEASA